MAIDSNLIGNSSSPQTFEVAREAVQKFMEAAEDPALNSTGPLEYAPPTFPTTFRMRIPGLELDTTKMQLLHGEQEYTYTRRLRIGEKVTCIVRIIDIRQRSGRSGDMTFMVSELIGSDEQGQKIFTGRSTSIIRSR